MIYLKYGIWEDGAVTWSDSQAFNELKFIRTPVSEHSAGRTLTGKNYVHVVSTRYEWNLVISADELLDANKLEFLKKFHFASVWKFSLDNWANSTEVTIADGSQAIDLIEGSKYLPEIQYIFTQKDTKPPLTIEPPSVEEPSIEEEE